MSAMQLSGFSRLIFRLSFWSFFQRSRNWRPRIDTSFAANWIFLRVPREGRAEGELNFGPVKLLGGGENEERCSDYTKRKG